jgi:4-diphosphocytidyl-2-C-methyl-D-erythritol kinase
MTGLGAPDAARALGPVVRLAPAKINLTLAVVGRRPDGYHDLHSVFVPLSLADRLSLAPGPPTGRDSLHVAGLATGPLEDDLVLRAIAATREAVGTGPGRPATPPLAARLEKHIPVGAGLGGGSSDAAATLEGALEAWSTELPSAARLQVGASLGSDVPFFLVGGPALVEGRGEQVTPLAGLRDDPEPPGVLLVTPAVHVATPDVFAVFAATRMQGDGSVRTTSAHLAEELRGGLSARDLVARAAVLAAANDLLAATALLVPGLVPFRRALARVIGRPIGMSGSGPTLWVLYPTVADAAAAADVVRTVFAEGAIAAPGDGPPTVAASAILTGPASMPGRQP